MNTDNQQINLLSSGSLPSNVSLALLDGASNIQSITIDNYSSCVIQVFTNQKGSGNPAYLIQPFTYKTVVALNCTYATVVFTGSISQNGYAFIQWDDNQNAIPQTGSLQVQIGNNQPPLFNFGAGGLAGFTAVEFGLPALNAVYVDNSTDKACTVVANSQGTQTPYNVPPNCRLWMNLFGATSITITNTGGTTGSYFAGVSALCFPNERLESKNNINYLTIPGTPLFVSDFQSNGASHTLYIVPANTTAFIGALEYEVEGTLAVGLNQAGLFKNTVAGNQVLAQTFTGVGATGTGAAQVIKSFPIPLVLFAGDKIIMGVPTGWSTVTIQEAQVIGYTIP